MGVVRAWTLARESDRWRAAPRAELPPHRTGVTDMWFGAGALYTASMDESVRCTPFPPGPRAPPALEHTKGVRALLPLLGEQVLLTGAGDAIRAYDVGDAHAPVLCGETDAHAHDVTALRLWVRAGEPWVVSASLDGTLRRWKLAGACAARGPRGKRVAHMRRQTCSARKPQMKGRRRR
jgi:hypothetical protein